MHVVNVIVNVCMCEYVCMYMYVCVCVYVCVHVCAHMFMCLSDFYLVRQRNLHILVKVLPPQWLYIDILTCAAFTFHLHYKVLFSISIQEIIIRACSYKLSISFFSSMLKLCYNR